MTNSTLWEDSETNRLTRTLVARMADVPKQIAMVAWVSASQVKVVGGNGWICVVGSEVFWIDTDVALGWADLDTGAEQNGKDYYVYVCDNGSTAPVFKLSLNSTFPSGFDASTSRKVGGFHNNPDGDILQYSVWDLNHRPTCSPEGMVKSQHLPVWYDIYLAADDGAEGVKSVHGATILDSIDWFTFVDRATKVGKRLLEYHEFMDLAAGSPEEVNISGSADPVTTGGHTATTAARMKSTIGAEDCCGAMWQWGLGMSYRVDGAATFDWVDLPGSKGSAYVQGTYGFVQPLFGGHWGNGADCGSRAVALSYWPWAADTTFGARCACDAL